MVRLISFVCVLVIVVLCALVLLAKPLEKTEVKADTLTVFLTGYTLGSLKPCGCSGGQLGGFDRRWAVFSSVPSKKRLIVDTGMFLENDGEQDLIKLDIMIQALGMLDYDLVNLTQKDIEISRNRGLLDSLSSLFNVISCCQVADVDIPKKFIKRFCLEKETVAVTIASLDEESVGRIRELFTLDSRTDLRSVDILILNTDNSAVIDRIAKMGIVDCIIVPSASDEPYLISKPSSPLDADTNMKPLVFTVGRFARYISRLQISINKGRLNLSLSDIPVVEDLPKQESLVKLYRSYQQFVTEANLLENYPRYILPDGLEYVGSQSCKSCHQYEYEKWSQKAHADAYSTLVEVGSQFDPECVICHVVGMSYESGFVSEQQTSHLKDVGCENCHGPGSEHNMTLGRAKTTEPKSTCLDCHTPETSGEYAGNEQLYLEKIVHWREPNLPADVK